jgi:hypothetical protein
MFKMAVSGQDGGLWLRWLLCQSALPSGKRVPSELLRRACLPRRRPRPQLSMSYSRAEGLLGGELISEQGFGA